MTEAINCKTDLNIPHTWVTGDNLCVVCGDMKPEAPVKRDPQSVCIVAVTIGNSDNKLTQTGWSHFFSSVETLVQNTAKQVHGVFVSPSTSKYQNACFLFELDEEHREPVRIALSRLARVYFQDSIAWLEGDTEFLRPEVKA